MEPIPQRMSVNPALSPDCKWYFGTPAISSVDFSFTSNVLAIGQINNAMVADSGGGYTLELNQLRSIVADKSAFVNLGVNQEWLNFGFRVRKSMFSFSITEKIKTKVSLPKDLFKLAFEGNGGANLGYDFNFNFGFDILHMREYALGYNRTLLNDKLTVGGRLKYIQGLNVIETQKNDIIFGTDPSDFSYTVTADVEVNMSTAVLGGANIDPLKAILGSPKNVGMGLDLGARLDLNDKVTLTASIIDLGQIKWADDTRNVKSRNPGASFTYKGIDVNEYIGDSASGNEGFEALADTILDVFALDTSRNSFTTGLLSEFYLGANLRINDRHNAGALLYGSFYNRQFYPAITLSWNSELGRVLALSASYTVMRGNYSNIGMGFGLNMGPEQLYFVSDNLIGFFLGNLKTVSLRFGWNHTIGRKKWEESQKK
jgi:hypothetical protein